MLNNHGLKSSSDGRAFLLNSEEGENVSILGNYFVSFNWILVIPAVVCEIESGLRMEVTISNPKQAYKETQ